MILTEISTSDVLLEGVKVIGMCFLLYTLFDVGKRYPSLAGRDWNLIIAGFLMMLIGFAFDWSDELIDYEGLQLGFQQAFIEEFGLIGGLFMVTIGFNRWFAFVRRFMGISQE